MAKILDAETRIRLVIPTPDEPKPVLIVRQPTDEQLDKYRRARLSFGRHRKLEINYEEDVRLIDSILEGVSGAEIQIDGEWQALDSGKHADWKQRIPRQWKISAALYFQSGEAEADEKN